MSNVTFWKPSNKIKPLNPDPVLNMNTKKKIIIGKKLGTGGAIVLGIVAVVALVVFILIVRPALAMTASVNALRSDKDSLQKALLSRDVPAMDTALNKSEADLTDLRKARDKNFGWAKNFGPTKNYFSDSEHFITAGMYLVQASRETVKLIMPFADAAGLKVDPTASTKSADTGLAKAFAQWVAVMPQVASEMDPVLAKLDAAGEELKPINPSRYPVKIKGVKIRSSIEAAQKTLSSISESAPDIKKALTVVPGLLGVGTGEKRYMIIMQNDKEIRATGGFWTNYATFKINNAELNSDFTSKDMYSIDLTLNVIDPYYTFPKAPLAYQKYLRVERLYARDTNISPDLPTNMDPASNQSFMFFYNLAKPIDPINIKPIDGIIAIDTQVIRELLQVTGPVTVNGFTYSPDNVVLELERTASLELREQQGRKKVLGDLMEGMLQNVFQSDSNLWPQLINKGIELAVRKHIIAYVFNNPEGQALIEEYNFGGRIIDPVPGDFSYVVSTNLGGDKTNWFVSKKVDHTLTKENGKYVDTVKITYSYPQPTEEFAPFVKRFKDWVRVYAPLNSEIISVTGTEDGTTTDQERNKTYFTGYVELGPTETKEMTFKYYLPDSVIKNGTYNLYLEKQPGIDKETHTVTVNGKTETVELTKDAQISKKL